MELKPKYKQTDVGLIPEDWDMRPLLTTVRIASGQVDPRIDPYRAMILVAPDHIESGTGRLLAQQTASDQRAISGKYLFSKGDIIYSKIRPYLRKAILAKFDGLCSADMYPLRPAGDVSAGFMLAVLLGDSFSKYAESVSVRSGMPKLNRAEMAEYAVALPPLPEQFAIEAALSDVDALLSALDRLITKKRDLKQAAMQQLLTGQTRLPSFSGKWETKPLGDVAFIRNQKVLPYQIDPDTFCIELEHLGQGNGRLLASSTARYSTSLKYQFAVGDVLFGRLRSYLRKYWMADRAGICTTEIWPLVVNPGLAFNGFLHALVQTTAFVEMAGISYGTHMPRADWAVVRTFQVRLPRIDEQVAIAAVLSDMDAELAALEQRREKTLLLKRGMMQELLTGRTRLV